MNDTKETKELYKKGEIADAFDSDRERFAHQKFKHKVEAQLLLRALNNTSSGEIKVLDVACGTGRMLPEVFKARRKVNYFGLDTSKAMTNKLKKKALTLKKEVKIVLADATKMPFGQGEFDVTYSYHLLWHLTKEDQRKIISEMVRVTKKNGFIIFDALNQNFFWEKIKRILGKNSNGLNKLTVLEAEQYLNSAKKVRLEKLSDARINNNFVYSLFNILNKIRYIFPSSFYHMFYIMGKK